MSQADIFEKCFDIGYLVSWKKLGSNQKEYGYIENLFYGDGDQRSFLMAIVLRPNGRRESFPVSYLHLESK